MIFLAFYPKLRTRLRLIWTRLEKHIFAPAIINCAEAVNCGKIPYRGKCANQFKAVFPKECHYFRLPARVD